MAKKIKSIYGKKILKLRRKILKAWSRGKYKKATKLQRKLLLLNLKK